VGDGRRIINRGMSGMALPGRGLLDTAKARWHVELPDEAPTARLQRVWIHGRAMPSSFRGPATIPRDAIHHATGAKRYAAVALTAGRRNPAGTRLTDSQTRLTRPDIEDVGDNHTTFFEMSATGSLASDHRKNEQLHQSWPFITERVGLDPNRDSTSPVSSATGLTVPRHREAAAVWIELRPPSGFSAIRPSTYRGAPPGPATGGARNRFYGQEELRCRGGSSRRCQSKSPAGPDSEALARVPEIAHDPAYGTAIRTALRRLSPELGTLFSWYPADRNQTNTSRMEERGLTAAARVQTGQVLQPDETHLRLDSSVVRSR